MQVHIVLTGTHALLMHNIRLADPADHYTRQIREITSKPARQKTEADYELIGELEWQGGLYYEKRLGPFIPGKNLKECLRDGAKKNRQGELLRAGVMVVDDALPLLYDGSRDIQELQADPQFRLRCAVGIGKSRTMRVRPHFAHWSLEADLVVDPEIINLDDLRQAADKAGQLVGLGDGRPDYGRFTAILEPVK